MPSNSAQSALSILNQLKSAEASIHSAMTEYNDAIRLIREKETHEPEEKVVGISDMEGLLNIAFNKSRADVREWSQYFNARLK